MLFSKKSEIPSAADALPGRDTPIAVPERHDVLGTPLDAAVPRGHRDRPGRPRLLLGRRAHLLAPARRLHDRRRLRGRLHAEPDATTRSAPAAPATPRSCWSRSTRSRSPSTAPARPSGRATTRPRACARATTSAPSTARRSTRPPTSSWPPRPRSRDTYNEALAGPATAARSPPRSTPAGDVLLRRGLPPAVPRQEPRRLLRHRRHRRRVPDRHRRQRRLVSLTLGRGDLGRVELVRQSLQHAQARIGHRHEPRLRERCDRERDRRAPRASASPPPGRRRARPPRAGRPTAAGCAPPWPQPTRAARPPAPRAARRNRFDDEPPALCRPLTKRVPTFDDFSSSPTNTPIA